jgi:hypothetical protein
MDTEQINNALSGYEGCFMGTFPCDDIPQVFTRPAAFVINTDPSTKPGEHWVVIWLEADGTGQYFDSFGMPPLQLDILNYLNQTCVNGWLYNTTMLQNVLSVTCGNYCVLFVKMRCLGYSYIDFINLFTDITKINDFVISHLYKEL